MNAPASSPIEPPPPAERGAKFHYASGSRPLDGYTIKRGIGRGGFGEVYFAVSDGGKELALKLIRRNLDVELRGVMQCLNLKHPNLLSIYDIRRDAQDDAWIVMEHMAGESLEEVLERSPHGLPIEDVRSWLRGILPAVAYLHDHGIVHRDLKPGNIFRDEGVVKLGDYGLSKFISCSRRSGQTESIGTVHYMAPEIANGRYGQEIDLYALGVIIYEMLTGRVPFEGESVGEVLMKHLTATPDVSRLPEPFRTAVQRALAKDPTARVRSAAELAGLLHIPLARPESNSAPLSPSAAVAQNPAGNGARVPPPPPSRDGASRIGVAPIVAAGLGAGMTHDEPVWRAIREAGWQLRAAWHRAAFSTPTKVVLIVLAILLLAGTAGIWIWGAIGGLAIYGMYRLVRAFIMMYGGTGLPPPIPSRTSNIPPPPPIPPGLASAAAAGSYSESSERGHYKRKSWRWRYDPGWELLRAKTPRTRLMELSGSLLLAAITAGVVAIPMVIVSSGSVEGARSDGWSAMHYAWLAIVGTLGAWAVLIPAKFWEGHRGEPVLRRLTMFVAGMLVGLAAYGLQVMFQLHPQSVVLQWLWTNNLWEPVNISHAAQHTAQWYNVNGAPILSACVGYFGFVFLLPRWWTKTDPMRRTRLSLWAVFTSIFCAWLVDKLLPFPQPWGVFVIVLTSLSAQIGAVWQRPSLQAGN